MFKALLYYDNYEKLIDMVKNMKKIGIDVVSHQAPNHVLAQVVEFNADFILLQTGNDVSDAYRIAQQILNLVKPPKIILIKKESEKLDPAEIMKVNISKVFSEPLDLITILAYMMEDKGFDPVDYFSKYLQIDYQPKKVITPQKGKVEEKFKERDYSKVLKDFSVEDADTKVTFDSDKLKNFKKNQKTVDLESEAESDREKFMKALLNSKSK